jgi:hypothetical protein
MNLAKLWDVAPCTLVDISDVSEKLTAIMAMMEAVSSSEMSVNIYRTTELHPRILPSSH